jgi:predicted ATPase/class 3 adenylate cyclase
MNNPPKSSAGQYLPSGTVTFLFTDIVDSTPLWEKYPDAMKSALAKHDSILRETIETNCGYVIKTTGDGVHAVFATALDAILSAIAVQRNLQSVIRTDSAVPIPSDSTADLQLKVRVGLHTGEAELRDGDYFGQTLNRAARIMSVGHGGQILISETTMQIAREHLPKEVSMNDLGQHHLKGLLQPERIFQVSTPGLPQKFPSLKSLAYATNNIPAQLTSFIGREREMAETTKRLENARLLTLIGPGGTGKTRLSIQLGTEMLPHFTDGVWFIELAPLADPALILQTIASVLGVRAQVGMPLANIVNDFLRAKNLLLILDNCEHLVEDSAQLADEILHNAPHIKIIASSREALGIAGETVYRVPSLSSPNQAPHTGISQVTREALLGFESVQLFVERASAANPKFQLTDENASSVAQICSRLDGIPLALELAASRVSAFTPEQIAKRLDDRFKLLTGGSRTALPRQQTLRALIDWSYDILTPDECTLLKRLSVFAGGWMFEAAETMFDDMDVLELLPQLVNKSLVTMDDEGDGPRYSLLETIRQYARDKLLESGEAAEVRNRHLAYHVQLAEEAEPHLYKIGALKWVTRLEAEYDNVRTAIEWGLDHDPLRVLRIAGALPNFWYRRGYESEGIRWIHEALERMKNQPEVQDDPSTSSGQGRERLATIARAWQAVSFMSFSQGDMPKATAAADTCAAFARQLGDKEMLAVVLTFSAASRMMSGHFEELDAMMSEIVGIVEESNNTYARGMTYGMLGSRLLMTGRDLERAHELINKGLGLLKGSENHFGHTMVLLGLAMGARFNGRFEEARAGFVPLIPIFHDFGDHHRSNMVRSELAHIERLDGQHDKAKTMYRETILEWKRLGHRAAVANQLECYAFIAKAQEQPERALKLLGAAEALRELISIDMSQLERVEYEREVADLKANMDEKVFAQLWALGRSMTMDEAIDLALNETPRTMTL